MEKDFLYKNRSFSSCLNTAYEWFCDNFKTIIRVTWLPVLLYSIFGGLLLIGALRDPRVQAFAQNSPGLFLTLFILAGIGMLVCGLWAWARFLSLLNGMTCKTNILRMLIAFLCYTVIISIVGSITSISPYRQLNSLFNESMAEHESGSMSPALIVEQSEFNSRSSLLARFFFSESPALVLPQIILESKPVNQFLPKLPSGYSVLVSFLVRLYSLIP